MKYWGNSLTNLPLSLFVAWIYREKIKKILNIPEKYIVPFVIPIGYPDEEPPQKSRKDLKDIML